MVVSSVPTSSLYLHDCHWEGLRVCWPISREIVMFLFTNNNVVTQIFNFKDVFYCVLRTATWCEISSQLKKTNYEKIFDAYKFTGHCKPCEHQNIYSQPLLLLLSVTIIIPVRVLLDKSSLGSPCCHHKVLHTLPKLILTNVHLSFKVPFQHITLWA